MFINSHAFLKSLDPINQGGGAGAPATNPNTQAAAGQGATQTNQEPYDPTYIFNGGRMAGLETGRKNTLDFMNHLIKSNEPLTDETIEAVGQEYFKKDWGNLKTDVISLAKVIGGLKPKSEPADKKSKAAGKSPDNSSSSDFELNELKQALAEQAKKFESFTKEAEAKLSAKESEIQKTRINFAIQNAAMTIPNLKSSKLAIREYIENRKFKVVNDEVIPQTDAETPIYDKTTGKQLSLAEDFQIFIHTNPETKNLISINSSVANSPGMGGAGFIANQKLGIAPTAEEYLKRKAAGFYDQPK